MKKTIRDELTYFVFNEVYQKLQEPKQKRMAFRILEAAVRSLAKSGFDHMTLEMIAREAGISRPLIHHYFDGIDAVEAAAIKYVRVLFQKMVIDSMMQESQADMMLMRYVATCFEWLQTFRPHALVWLSFLHHCSTREELRALNTTAVRTGEERIAALLVRGREQEVLNFHGDPGKIAKAIQLVITGALVTSVSEDHESKDLLSKLTSEHCLAIAGGSNLIR